MISAPASRTFTPSSSPTPTCLGLLLVLLLSASAAAVEGQNWDDAEYMLRPTELVPTTKWFGDRYARGSLSVLVISGEYTSFEHYGRKWVELKRALNLDLEFAIAAEFKAEKSKQVDDARILHLLASRKWDVIAFYGMPMGHSPGDPAALLPEKTMEAIVAQIRAGKSGSVVVAQVMPPALGVPDFDPFAPDSDLAATVDTSLAGRDVLAGLAVLGRVPRAGQYKGAAKQELAYQDTYMQVSKVGAGRVVRLDIPALAVAEGGMLMMRSECLPVSGSNRIDSDYFIAELGRALLFAAGKEPAVQITAAPAGVTTVDFDDAATPPAVWKMKVNGDKRDLVARWRLRDTLGLQLASGEKAFAKASGAIELTCTLPLLPTGHAYLDLFVDGPRGRETYGYAAYRVVAPCSVTVQPSKPAFEPGVAITGTVALTDSEPGDQLHVSLWDGERRRVVETHLPITAGAPQSFSLSSADLDGIPYQLEAEVLRGGRRAGWATSEVNLLHRRQDKFNVLMWGNATGPYAYWSQKSLYRTGVTASMDAYAYQGNMTYMPMVGHFKGNWRGVPYEGPGGTELWRHIYSMDWDEKTGVRTLMPLPWNDPVAWDEILGMTESSWQIGLQKPVFVYDLYDEHEYWVADTSAPGMKAYQTWLKEQYANDLAALNTEWGSAYKRWEDITDTLGMMDEGRQGDPWEGRALEDKNYARWHDRQTFAKINFNNLVLDGWTARARKTDPKALLGFEGSGGFGGSNAGIGDGMVFDDLLASSGFYCPYDGLALELIRSLRPPGYIYGFWIGYERHSEPLIRQAWRMVVNGAPSIWWWMLTGTGRFHGWLASDDQPYPAGQQLIDECVRPLREGLGDLLIQLDQQHDGIALYYSQAAAHAGALMAKPSDNPFGTPFGAGNTWHQLIEDCGNQWLYLSKERVLAGDLAKRGIKLLILPVIQPLGADEVAALDQFAQAGGTIIADVRPGVMSGHCRPIAAGPADALFGIERTGTGSVARVKGTFNLTLGETRVPLKLSDGVADLAVKQTTAVSGATADGARLMLVRSVGKGRTVLMNCSIESYGANRDAAAGQDMRDFFRGLTTALQIAPRLRLSAPSGGAAPMPEIATWKKGNATLYAVFGGQGDATATLPGKSFLFDWRRGALGQTDQVKLDPLGSASIQFIASYPYDPGQPVVKASQAQVTGGGTIEFTVAMAGVPADEKGVFSYHTRLLDPAGGWVDVIPWSVQGVGGAAKVRVRFAHNDLDGAWTLSVREVTTGREAKATVTKQTPSAKPNPK